jgi:hypothetical protein
VRIWTVGAALMALAVAVGGCAAWQTLRPSLALRLPTSQSCVVSAEGEVSLNPEQMANAATIAAVGIRRGVPVRAVVVALATARQESKLINLPGGDRDSVGLFQQRPSQDWGSPEQISDPRYAAGAFYTALLKVPGWQNMRVTDAAQAVQHSATPEAYERWADEADVLARALAGDANGAVACTVTVDPDQRGTAAADSLTTAVRQDWGDVKATRSAKPIGVTLLPNNSRAGWQYAHWLVAHAAEHGVKRVSFGAQEWTAEGGHWRKLDGDATTKPAPERVVAEVYPDG